jgi:hypothetical protein
MLGISNIQCLSIGDIKIKLRSKSNISIGIGYKSFVIPENNIDSFFEIEIIPAIPQELKNEDLLVFESNDNNQKLWHVCSISKGYKVIVFDSIQSNTIQQIAFIYPDSKSWIIYTECDSENTVFPLFYPMGPLIMYYLTTVNSAIMIHSSGIVDGEKGRLFSGFSGVGKSTMAGIWQQNGNEIINDDRLMLTIVDNNVIMHNTPMFYDAEPKKHKLHAIYLLKQTKDNCITKLQGVDAMTRLMAFCIQHAYDKQFIQHHLATLFAIYSTIPIYELGFKPDAEIIEFIRLHE